MPQLIDPAALAALVPPDAVSFALEHREQLQQLLASTDDALLDADASAHGGGKSGGQAAMDAATMDAFRLSYQSAFEEALRQSLPPTGPAKAPSEPEPEPEPQGGVAPGAGEPWPTVRPANWPDSKKPVTDDSKATVEQRAGPKPDTVLWTPRDRRVETQVSQPAANTWGAAEDPPEAMLKVLHSGGVGGLDAVDENGWTCLMWCARLNRPANISALLQAGARASQRSTKDVWRYPARQTASQLSQYAQDWDGADRVAVRQQLEAAESEEGRSRALQAAYDERTEAVKAGHAAAKKDIVSGAGEEVAAVDVETSAVAAKAKMRSLLRDAEAKRIQAETKAKRAARDATATQSELETLKAEYERYKVTKTAELQKARTELLDITSQARTAELKAAHGLG